MTIDELEDEIRRLSDAEFSQLAGRLGLAPPPRPQWAEIEIDDDEDPPIAVIENEDGSIHKLDIFAAIRENFATIAHPVVLIAINHWFEILRHRPALTFGDDWFDHEDLKAVTEWVRSGRPNIASRNLARIGQAIIEAADARSVSRQAAFVALVEQDGLDQENTLLFEAFKWLRQDKTRNRDLKLAGLESALRELAAANSSISAERVVAFLRSEKGEAYVNPTRWEAICNAYIAWHFGISQSTVVSYRSRAQKVTESSGKVNPRYFLPRQNRYSLSEEGAALLRRAMALPEKAWKDAEKDG